MAECKPTPYIYLAGDLISALYRQLPEGAVGNIRNYETENTGGKLYIGTPAAGSANDAQACLEQAIHVRLSNAEGHKNITKYKEFTQEKSDVFRFSRLVRCASAALRYAQGRAYVLQKPACEELAGAVQLFSDAELAAERVILRAQESAFIGAEKGSNAGLFFCGGPLYLNVWYLPLRVPDAEGVTGLLLAAALA
ncbi:MAG: hypothetical protein LBR73_02120 [Oscillospiraceae bacterium]|jgi:hypothetical protein|nr:hypothetical protein [Oscillospiraceae bacterium]